MSDMFLTGSGNSWLNRYLTRCGRNGLDIYLTWSDGVGWTCVLLDLKRIDLTCVRCERNWLGIFLAIWRENFGMCPWIWKECDAPVIWLDLEDMDLRYISLDLWGLGYLSWTGYWLDLEGVGFTCNWQDLKAVGLIFDRSGRWVWHVSNLEGVEWTCIWLNFEEVGLKYIWQDLEGVG